ACAWLGFTAYGVAGLACAGVAVFSALAVPHLIAQRMGGVTGDVMGASVLITETIAFTTFALVLGAI
ncbi:MAG: adenosylcobinamide-GDP ribazoletransferase, partial [Actinobacteria bacterium]